MLRWPCTECDALMKPKSKEHKILLLTPPLVQLNTPYPASAYLTGFLRQHGYMTVQRDPAIDLVLKLFSRSGLELIADACSADVSTDHLDCFFENFDAYLQVVEPVVAFLQGKDPSLAARIVSRNFLPENTGFAVLDQWESMGDGELDWAFGAVGIQDKAKFYASLFLGDLARVVQDGVDESFSLSRYGERLAAAVESFDDVYERVVKAPNLIDHFLKEIVEGYLRSESPHVVGLTVPFPGNFLGALIIAKVVKDFDADIKVILGGGYVNTELRSLSEKRVFDFVDFVTLDDGEAPVLQIMESLETGKTARLFRTFIRQDDVVKFVSDPKATDVSHNETGIPTYDGLDLGQYMSVLEMPNPMHRIWSDGRWNKLTLAHGCYWAKCSFCDVSLDYIERYQEADIDTLIQRIEAMIAETGQRGFHFVDEAAPPKVLFALAKRLIEKNITITWWGNIRFEKSFSAKMCELLAQSGCIAVTGGLEVASERILRLINKGVTVEQVAKVAKNFSSAGVLVHAYLMYGFPTQTVQETIDSLERVRQLFLNGYVQSAYWHRFAATIHSPVGQNPEKFGVSLKPLEPWHFAQNDIDFYDPTGVDHDMLGRGLNRALYNYMLGIGLQEPLSFWFEIEVPPASSSIRVD